MNPAGADTWHAELEDAEAETLCVDAIAQQAADETLRWMTDAPWAFEAAEA